MPHFEAAGAYKIYFLSILPLNALGEWADLKLTKLSHCSYSTTGKPTEFEQWSKKYSKGRREPRGFFVTSDFNV